MNDEQGPDPPPPARAAPAPTRGGAVGAGEVGWRVVGRHKAIPKPLYLRKGDDKKWHLTEDVDQAHCWRFDAEAARSAADAMAVLMDDPFGGPFVFEVEPAIARAEGERGE